LFVGLSFSGSGFAGDAEDLEERAVLDLSEDVEDEGVNVGFDFGHDDVFAQEDLLVVVVECVLTVVFCHQFKRIHNYQTVPQVSVDLFLLEPFLYLIQHFSTVDYLHLNQVFLYRTRLPAFL
jgi:hypothetical protein